MVNTMLDNIPEINEVCSLLKASMNKRQDLSRMSDSSESSLKAFLHHGNKIGFYWHQCTPESE